MATVPLAKQLTDLVDALQAKLDSYVADRESLVQDYNVLLDENDRLRNKVMLLMKNQK